MEIKLVTSDKKEFLDLLLLADEQESMIDRYLERGDMFVLYDDGLKALCVVTREGASSEAAASSAAPENVTQTLTLADGSKFVGKVDGSKQTGTLTKPNGTFQRADAGRACLFGDVHQ